MNSTVALGEHTKRRTSPENRERVRTFYSEVLSAHAAKKSDTVDVFEISTNFSIAFAYDEQALSAADQMKAIWLELRTPDAEALTRKILAFGIKAIDYSDKKHFYFQAPCGQVYRLAPTLEKTSS